MGVPKELTFDNEGIQQLAKDVDFLLRELTTPSGNNKGNLPDFETASEILTELRSLNGSGTTAYCKAYQDEYNAVLTLYSTLKGQLETLQSTLSETGSGYQQREGTTKQTVARTNPDNAPLAST